MSSSKATIGDYVVTSRLGSGSFAVVYKGYHKITKLPVAIKAMSLTKLNTKLLANLEMEIAIMRQIDHPNVVKLYEIKKTEKHMYLILEYCAGGDLQQFMRRQHQQQQNQQNQQTGRTPTPTSTATTSALPEQVARHFLKELAQGMKCLWTHNLIHRDLKPQNLLLTEDSPTASLKIADFGFARHLATTSLAETLCGSPLYMAPEILKFQKYDAKADLWSVGTILYELVVGKPPYGGSNHVQLLANIERNDLKFPSDVAVSNECRTLLTGLLHRRPVNRMGFDEFFHDPFVGLSTIEREQQPAFQTIRMATSIREEEDEEEQEQEQKKEEQDVKEEEKRQAPSVGPAGRLSYGDRAKERSASESHMDMGGGGAVPPLQASMRSSRSGNMEVMQNVFGNTSSSGNTSAAAAFGSSTALRRSSRLGRSRRATSSGAIITGNSPKLSPQMSPNVLPSPGPRINPFKELSESPPTHTGGALDMRGSLASMRSSQRASRTHVTIVQQKTAEGNTSNHALDSSGEYVLVDDGGGSGAGARTPSPSSSPPHVSPMQNADRPRQFQRQYSPRGGGGGGNDTTPTTLLMAKQPNPTTYDSPSPSNVAFSHEYAQKLVDIVSLRIQAIAPIAEQLCKMSSFASSSSSAVAASSSLLSASGNNNLASVLSLNSSLSSSSGQALIGISSATSSVALSASGGDAIVDKKQYVFAAEALALYVKCMRMLQPALLYLRQDPACVQAKARLTTDVGSSSPSRSPTDRKAPVPWQERSRKVSMAFLIEQLNVFLDRADQCKRRMATFLTTSQARDESQLKLLVVSQEELLYSHAIRLGKEGAIKEVLGQSQSAYELYLQAMLLLESLLMDHQSLQQQQQPPSRLPLTTTTTPTTSATSALTVDDQKRIASFVKALDERLTSVKHSMEKQQQLGQHHPSPLRGPRPMVPATSPLATAVTATP